MTEVPEHLLQRSRDRRAALGLGGGDAGGDAAPAATPATTESAAPAAAPVAKPAAAPVPAAPKPPPFVPPYVKASERRVRVPLWVMPVLAFLPVWGILYAQSLSEAPSKEVSELAAGATVYTGKQCAGCHGATGGGGAGRPLNNGEVVKTFPNIADHLEWVQLGTAGYNSGTYGDPNREGGARKAGSFGNMPAFHGNLTEKELLEVVRHEREAIGSEKDIKVDSKGAREWPNGKPMLDAAGKLIWDDGTPMFDATGHLTKQVDHSKPAS